MATYQKKLGMTCPSCKANTELPVIDSRFVNNKIRRRRICPLCKNRFTTYEILISDKTVSRELVIDLSKHIILTKKKIKEIVNRHL
jgi:transcriptional regulator NrdR family protein